MSKKVTEESEKKDEKIVTRYDRKVQKRKEQAEQEKKERTIGIIVSAVIIVAVVALIASFPIRTWMAVNKTFVEIGGDKVSQVEFDYYYNTMKNSYVSQYGSTMSYMGIDLSGDLSSQMYSDTLTWQDYFQQLAVSNIQNNKALLKEANEAGFTYDEKEEFDTYKDVLKAQASEAGVSLSEYLKQAFGSYATIGRLEKTIKEYLHANAYYRQVSENSTPADEEIDTYYAENKDSYDSVDYRMLQFDADLPTEPTDLADPVEESEDTADSTESTDGSTDTEEAYQPSEAEIAYAMSAAKEEADAALKTISTEGELTKNAKRTTVNSNYRDWMFDESRKDGDTTVIEDEDNHRYYVVEFVQRYLDQQPSVKARMVITENTDGQTILDEWKAGEATEASFEELCKKYSDDTSVSTNGGLYEGLLKSNLENSYPDLSDWLFSEDRKEGDTTVITMESGTTYVVYYISQGDPEWKINISSTLLNQKMSDYLTQISENITVEDPKGNLRYLAVQASEEAAASESAQEATEETDADSTAASEETESTTTE